MKIGICTYNKIAPEGLAVFDAQSYRVQEGLADADAILLRSHKLSVDQLGEQVQAIGRAGAGVNNIPVDECTRRGIVVFNAPGANANAVAELTLAILLTVERRLPAALNFMRQLGEVKNAEEMEEKVEEQKRQFRGREFYGTRLGVVGLGAIGSRLAHCAVEMGVEVLGYDPAISVENAWRLPANVKRCNSLAELLSASDSVSLHVPMLPTTVDLIDDKALALMRPGAFLLNYARGPIVNEDAALRALDAGHLGMYASDFPSPALQHRQFEHGDVFLTPHLGASTYQAEVNSSVMAARQLDDFLRTGKIVNSVNYPNISADWPTPWRLAIANENVPRVLGSITSELASRNLNVADMTNKSRGDAAWNLINLDQEPWPDLIAALKAIKGVSRVRVLSQGI